MVKELRKVEEIHAEYSNLCAKAGHLQYQISVLSKDLKTLNDQLETLNFEAAASAAKAKESEESNG